MFQEKRFSVLLAARWHIQFSNWKTNKQNVVNINHVKTCSHFYVVFFILSNFVLWLGEKLDYFYDEADN